MKDEGFGFEEFVIGLVSGLFIGAIAGTLLAPAAGNDTRKRLSGWANDTKGTFDELLDQAKVSLDAASGKAEQYLGLQEKGIKKRLDEIRAELERYDLNGL